MTKAIFTFFCSLSFVVIINFSSTAQNLSLDWVKSNLSTSGVIWTSQIVFDQEGNILVAGTFQGQVDLGFGSDTIILNSNGNSYDGFVLKLDSSGMPIWTKKIGGLNSDGVNTLTVDSLNNIYIIGNFRDTVSFDSTTNYELVGSSNSSMYILKLNENGDFEWVKSPSPGIVSVNKLRVSEAGNFYLTGFFRDSVDLDFGPNIYQKHANFSTIFLGKYDSEFNLIWLDTVAGDNYQYQGMDLNFDTEGNIIYIADKSYGAVIRKLDSNGLVHWSKHLTGNIDPSSLSCDQLDNIILCGSFNGNTDFDPGSGVFIFPYYYGENGFVLKLNELGEFLWAANVSSGGTNKCISVVTDTFGSVYVGGSYQGNIDFDPKTSTCWINPVTSSFTIDAFIWKLDSLGNFITVKTFGGSDSDLPANILIDSFSNIYNFGYYSGFSNDFDPSSNVISFPSIGLSANYLIKFTDCQPVTETINITTCDSLLWLNGITYYNSVNPAKYTFVSSLDDGCDSIVNLSLILNYSSLKIDTISSCGPFTWSNGITYNYSTNAPTYTLQNQYGCDSIIQLHLEVQNILTTTSLSANAELISNTYNAFYQWLDCDSNMTEITGQTNQSFLPTSNGSYAVIISHNGCIDTSACVEYNLLETGKHIKNTTINLYPNPTKKDFTISFNQNQSYTEIYLYSITGQLIEHKKISNAKTAIFELDNPNGIYFIEILDQNNDKTILKLIKN